MASSAGRSQRRIDKEGGHWESVCGRVQGSPGDFEIRDLTKKSPYKWN